MIHIDTTQANPDQAWLQRAADLTHQLNNAASQADRNAIIDNNADCWRKIKDWLLELSNGKCWFSEAKDVYSHWDVEHFRPKKSAKQAPGVDREGYWWLSFDWGNYRICGNVGNSKKGTFFPLRNPGTAATSQNRSTTAEEPYLLDPTVMSDVDLLSFDDTGDAIPKPGCSTWET
ncbi:MAG: hypothetical protein KAH23_03615 [Kiritimatiellae bacterium]|nr:hypothetical protein [Kiritimatiellia bacterium]